MTVDRTLDRKGWYDGRFYALFIDTKQSPLRKRIIDTLNEQDTVLDVGCGTGGLALVIAHKTKYVLGVDISARQIKIAEKRAQKAKLDNIDFLQAHAGHLSGQINRIFDKAIIVFMIHEMAQKDRIFVLRDLKKIAREIIILDYAEKMPLTFLGMMVNIIEYFAGKEHYNNYRQYMANNGIQPILEQAGYQILTNRLNKSKIFRLIRAVQQ